MKIQKSLLFFSIFLFSCLPAFAVGSGGFEVATYSARALGKGGAVAADPEEPSIIPYNPAGITQLDGNQVSANVTLVTPFFHYEASNGRGEEDNSVSTLPVPGLYTSLDTPVESLKMGLGVYAPFGLTTKYSSVGNFRYATYYNELKLAVVNPVLAYEINPHLSIGGGFMYGDSAFKQVGKINSLLLTGDAQDADYEFDVNGTGTGWNLGVLWTINERHSTAFSFRSAMPVHYKGRVSVDNLTGTIAAVFGGASFTTSIDTDITFPGAFTAAYRYSPNERWDIEADVTWTDWSQFDALDVTFGTSNAVLAGFDPTLAEYDDTFSFALGTSYRLNDQWTVMGGYFFWEMAAQYDFTYTAAIPDGDKHGLSVGAQYKVNDHLTVDLAYLFTFSPENTIDTSFRLTNGANMDGDYSAAIHIVSLGLTYKF
jgi:long-chain fatty acid transport protein